jgi:hypothetical protein
MVRLSRRSKISQQRNRRQSQRRGGRPIERPHMPNEGVLVGKEGSFCASKPEGDCKKIKACNWIEASGKKRAYCRSRIDRGEGEASDEFKQFEAAQALKQKERLQSMKDTFRDRDNDSQDSVPVVPSSLVLHRPPSASPQQKPRSVSPKKSSAKSSPVKAPNVPLGCVQKTYLLRSAAGKTYESKRCIDSHDPKINDTANCMVNPQTNKCKSRERE